MRFPDMKTLGTALSRWRKEELHVTAETISERMKEINPRMAVEKGAILGWETGQKSPSYKKFAEVVCPSYEIGDVDLFLDFCIRRDSLDEVVIIPSGELDNKTLASGVRVAYAPDTVTAQLRIRIDQYFLEPGSVTGKPVVHNGHEYCLLLKGQIEVRLGEEDWGDNRPPKTKVLEKGSAIVFSGYLYHQLANVSDGVAHVLIARPAGMKPVVR